MARKVTVVVESGKGGFSCFMANDSDDLNFGLIGDGKTAKAAMEDFLIVDKEMRESFEEDGEEYPDLDFHFVLDVGSFFDYYPLSITAFAKYIGKLFDIFDLRSRRRSDDIRACYQKGDPCSGYEW